MTLKHIRMLCPALFAAGSMLLTTSCIAQAAPPSQTTPKWQDKQIHFVVTRQPFGAILSELSRQIGTSIMADDEPLVKAASFDIEGSAKAALDKIANTFDYSWQTSKSGMVLMSKRFDNPQEIPQMHLLELQQMVKQSLEALSFIKCDSTFDWWSFKCKTLYDLMTPEQKQYLQTGKALGYAEWTPEQRDLVWQMTLNRRFSGFLTGWNDLNFTLSGFARAAIQRQNRVIVDGAYVAPAFGQHGKEYLFFLINGKKDTTHKWLLYFDLPQEQLGEPQGDKQ